MNSFPMLGPLVVSGLILLYCHWPPVHEKCNFVNGKRHPLGFIRIHSPLLRVYCSVLKNFFMNNFFSKAPFHKS